MSADRGTRCSADVSAATDAPRSECDGEVVEVALLTESPASNMAPGATPVSSSPRRDHSVTSVSSPVDIQDHHVAEGMVRGLITSLIWFVVPGRILESEIHCSPMSRSAKSTGAKVKR